MLSVGQKLWCVPRDTRKVPHWVTVEKVGRKWADIGQGRRIDATTLESEKLGFGYNSHGDFYLTREEWDAKVERSRVISALSRGIPHIPPDVSADTIRQAAAMLGISLDGLSAPTGA